MHVVVIGGGPGGYVSAIRAAQLGAQVTIIEKKYYGGTCLNVGCIPTKVLLHTSEIYSTLLHDAEALGIAIGKVSLDWRKLQERKEGIVNQLVSGVEMLLKSNGIQMIAGQARFTGSHEVTVTAKGEKDKVIGFDKAIIATGSESIVIPVPGASTEGVITSEGALSLEEVPESLCIIGGGVIGSEFASLYSELGTNVTIVEMLPELIAVMDQEVVAILKEALTASGVKVYTGTKVDKIEKKNDKLCVVTSNGEVLAEKVLLATGRRPFTEGLGLNDIGIKTDKGAILVNRDTFQTSLPHIYAIGDCNGGILLAHVASAEGTIAAEHLMKKVSGLDLKTTPSAVYTKPELASVGLTEKEAKAKGYRVKTGLFPLYANGKSLIMNDTKGIVKFVVDGETDEILGMHMAGPRATDLIIEGGLALRLEATMDEIMTTIHAHPTVSEGVHEAAHAVHHSAIHLPKGM
jgi:dihydrolipoamide dehydrogenase